MDRFLKILGKVGAVFFVLSFVILSGFVSVLIPATSTAFYRAQYRKVDENGYTPVDYVKRQSYFIKDEKSARFIMDMTEDKLVDTMMHAVRYCLYLEDDLNPTVNGYKMQIYRQDELSHMQDVKKVFGGGLIIVAVALTLFLVTLCFGIIKRKSYYNNCRKVPFYALIGVLLVLLTLGILALTSFELAFDIFHKILFDGNWEFQNGVMIEMIGYIFEDIAVIIISVWLGLLALFSASVYLCNKLLKRKYE